jgi:hypothetical protein
VKALHNAQKSLVKASHDTSRLMSAHLRSEARKAGWPDHIVSNLHVTHSNGSFNIHAHPDQREDVLDLEYGTTSTQPNRAIHRFSKNQHEAEKFLVKRLFHHMGVK